MSAQSQLRLDQVVVECGGAATGTVTWSGNGRQRRVGVVLRYRTEGRGDTDAGVAARCELGTDEAGQARFQLVVPPAGPVTYHGQLVRVLWQAAVTIQGGGSARAGTSVLDLTVAPRGWLSAAAPPGWRDGP